MHKRLKKFLFGGTPDLQRKQIRQFWLAMGFALLLCAVIGVVLYGLNKQGRF
jgi:cytochrome c-type biogenesis protein CcmE